MNRFTIGLKLLKKNIGKIIIFEAIYKLITMAFVTPLLVELINISLRIAGMNYLTNSKVVEFILKPSTIGILLLILLVFTAFCLVEYTSILFLFDATYHELDISIITMFKQGLKASLKILKKHNEMLIFFVIVILPITHFSFLSGYLATSSEPEFFIQIILSRLDLTVVFLVINLLICIVAFRWLTSVHYFVLEKMNFKKARKASENLNKKGYIELVSSFILWQIIIFLFLFVTYFIIAFLVTKGIKIFVSKKTTYASALFILTKVFNGWIALYTGLVVPITLAFVSGYYYARKVKSVEPIEIPIINEPKKKAKSKFQRKLSVVILISAILNIIYVYTDFGISRGNTKVQFFNRTQIAAHRGDSVDAPENTISAIKSAIDKHADFAEIDVQQTKDGQVVLMHDSNTLRTSGINVEISDTTYTELQEFDVGSWFGEEYVGEKIPKLSEVLELAKDKIKLNIEIKRTGKEKNIEEEVVKLIEEYDFEEDCVVTSFQADTLKKVKQYNENIKCGYILSVAYGDFSRIAYADALSINYTFASSMLINNAHNAKKQVYVWTVNDEENVNTMINRGVDMIITDNPVMASETRTAYQTNPWLVKLIRFLVK